MRYISTRGAAPILGFDDVLLAGLARESERMRRLRPLVDARLGTGA